MLKILFLALLLSTISSSSSFVSNSSRTAVMASRGPDLKKYMDKRLSLSLNGSRKVEGTLRGYDQFMNVVLDNTVEQLPNSETKQIGMVVRGRVACCLIFCCQRCVVFLFQLALVFFFKLELWLLI